MAVLIWQLFISRRSLDLLSDLLLLLVVLFVKVLHLALEFAQKLRDASLLLHI